MKKFLVALWICFSFLALFLWVHTLNARFLFLIPLPFFILPALYFLVLIHELGHVAIGFLLKFPVIGIEIGTFPFKNMKLWGLTLRIGKFPWWGRTLLGVTNKTFTPLRKFMFVSGGMAFELFFFACLYFPARGWLFFEILWFLFFADQLLVNLVPKYEAGQPINDGALIIDLFFPGTSASSISNSIF